MRVIPLSWNPVCWHKTLSNFKEIKSNLRHLFGPAQKNKWIRCFLTCRPSTTCPRLRQEAPMKSLTSSNVFWNWRTSCTNKKGRSLFVSRTYLIILAKMMVSVLSPWIKNLNAKWKSARKRSWRSCNRLKKIKKNNNKFTLPTRG